MNHVRLDNDNPFFTNCLLKNLIYLNQPHYQQKHPFSESGIRVHRGDKSSNKTGPAGQQTQSKAVSTGQSNSVPYQNKKMCPKCKVIFMAKLEEMLFTVHCVISYFIL